MTFVFRRWIDLHRCSIILLFVLLLGAQTGRAQKPSSSPDTFGRNQQNFNPSMGVVIIVLIAALFFLGFFSIYIRHCSQDNTVTAGRRTQTGSVARSRRAPRGLDRAVIDSFPVFDYAAVRELKIGKGALECAVCLTEFEDEDTLRLIPKCDHVFHPDCIDAWLVAHTTCPVCRSDLVPGPDPELGGSTHAVLPPELGGIGEVLISNGEEEEGEEIGRSESMEQPLQGVVSRSRTMRRNISIGRPRSWLGRMKLGRSYSTGHVAVKQWENMERFTLRLPEEVRKQLVNGKLERTTSLLVLPRETSSRRGYRTGFSEGSSRGGYRTGFSEGSSRGGLSRFGIVRSDRPDGRSDRWTFSLAPPFFSRAPSVKSPKVAAATVAASREGSLRGSIRVESTRLPV